MQRRRTLAVVLVAVAMTLVGVVGCGEDEVANPSTQIDVARDTSAKAGILAIQTGVQAYVAVTGTVPPEASQDVLGDLVQPWPENPWKKAPMAEGTDPGDYTYTPGSGTSYTLVGHLSGGREYTKP